MPHVEHASPGSHIPFSLHIHWNVMHRATVLSLGHARSRSLDPVPANSTDAGRIPRPRSPASSSGPSSSFETSQQGNPIATPFSSRMLGDSASQLDRAPPSATSPTTPSGLLTHYPTKTNLASERCDPSGVPPCSRTPVTASQQPILSPPLTGPFGGNSNIPYGVQSISESRNVYVDGSMNKVTYTNSVVNGPNDFMKTFMKETIPGAAFDSSARDPPPRCHPGTRLAILERCIYFILNCHNKRKMRWVFGAAGVGKSAIMQSVAETSLPPVTLRASIFFVHGHIDGSKAIVTLAYQLAVKCEPYRVFIERELDHDPSLLQKSMSVQFNKMIVEPFTHHPPLNSVDRVLIIIDGLDECGSRRTQEELLRLISDLCITYPSSPLIWMLSSRPEPHITSFFTQITVEPAYEMEEIFVDSDEAREDVERFLRNELKNIQIDLSFNPRVPWPSEQDFWKLAEASSGLFAYVHTVTKYIGDPDVGNPITQLDDVLKIIDAHPLPNDSWEHPMAQLDALYAQILSKVPDRVKSNMRKLILAMVMGWERLLERNGRKFIVLCNWLGMTYHDAYAALRHLCSVLKVPRRDKAHEDDLQCFHKSFLDYISDFTRSRFSPDVKEEAQRLTAQCAFRVLQQAPNKLDLGDVRHFVHGSLTIGRLARGTGAAHDILLTWPVDEEMDWDDNITRLYIYKMAIASVVEGIRNGQEVFYNSFCIRLLTTHFVTYDYPGVPILHEAVFHKSRRRAFIKQGLVKKVPIKMLDFADIVWHIRMRLDSPITSSAKPSVPWLPSCWHERVREERDEIQVCTAELMSMSMLDGYQCDFCCRRLELNLKYWKTWFPDRAVLVLFTLSGQCFVEFQFVDPEDGVSEWTYWFVHEFAEETRRKLGSAV